MTDLVGLIPAAGRGTRAYPYTSTIPKGLLEVDGRAILERNIGILRDQLGIGEVYLVVGYLGHVIREALGNGRALGVELHYIQNDSIDLGLAHSMRLAGRAMADRATNCVALLSDECYVGCDHARMREATLGGALAACGVLATDLPRQIRRNYAVELDGDRITRIVEKPKRLPNDLLGTGTYYLTPRVFELLEQAFADRDTAPDWMGFLAERVQAGDRIDAIRLGGEYANVNDRDELNRANLLVRHRSFAAKRVSVAVVAESSDQPVADVIARFARAEAVHEIIVAARDTGGALAELERDPRLRVLDCADPSISFGDMTRRALDAATGDILVLTQSDDSFSPDDLDKLLSYIPDTDLVVGTRTSRQMIEQGSSMRGSVRFAHIALGKLMELMWWGYGPRFTDVGCVFRAIWSDTWRLVRPRVVSSGQEIYPEMVVEVLHARRRVTEIPVNYYNRDPLHEAVTSPYQTSETFFRILRMLVVRSLRRLRRG